MHSDDTEPRSYAFLGVRPCDLRAIAIQDRVLTGGTHTDRGYRGRRERAFLVVVECTEPGATCFCVSMNAGPAAGPGYDLALTEVLDDAGHRFLVRAGSDEGASVLAGLPRQAADEPPGRRPGRAVAEAADRMGRTTPATDLRVLMRDTLNAERWDDVAGTLPDLRQLHDGLPDLLLHHGRGRHRPDRRPRRAVAPLGVVLRPRVHPPIGRRPGP